MIQNVYYQLGYADPILENDYVLGLVRLFVPGAGEVTGIDETGGEARTYAIDSDMILKVQRPHQLRLSTSLKREVFFLKQLEGVSGVSVPKVLGYAKEGILEYTLMTRMPGRAVKYSELSAVQRKEALFELGKMLVPVHNLDIAPFYDSGLFPDIDKNAEDVKERLKYLFDLNLGRFSEKLTEAEISKANEMAACELSKVNSVRIVPCHANPGPEHTFVDEGKFSGIIDFGDAYISHPIFDLRRWPLEDRKHVINGYISAAGSDECFEAVKEASTALDTIINDLRVKYL